eukprot:3064789-Karenia_brevis.AAC.1
MMMMPMMMLMMMLVMMMMTMMTMMMIHACVHRKRERKDSCGHAVVVLPSHSHLCKDDKGVKPALRWSDRPVQHFSP